ncbi:DoxX family membrane protein [Vibrio nigripulchritudo]|uniref:DoxX family membrane protein n=1 Tax=Vibrio nigripulchritudo TaxID=28173 RepID=UPI002493B01F|nr:DoxX family membrane protein [Vibrio nigripulchritudo]BDU40097.1 hypothetical protein TUMSATVNIG2_45660 [Vibrio nigripulchritudo]BDU45821.1 hypothetical protein TUMSATVNIG3_46190 [Vibrio nigripulchritudo]
MQKTIRPFLAVFLLFPLFLFSLESSAHVKWFVDTENAAVQNFQPYSFTDIEVLVWIVIAIFLVCASIFLDPRLPTIPIIDAKARKDVIEILRIFTGMALLLTAYDGSIIAPHYDAYGHFGTFLVFFQATIGIMLISNRLIFHASILLILLFMGAIAQYGFIETLEYCNILGIALFLMFNSFSKPELQEKYKPYSVASLRIFTGVALITLGVSEKLTGALYGEAFIEMYQWNFMENLGFEFYSDRLLVLSAGIMEVVFGTILILGTTTRLNVLVISSFMFLSNVTFLVQNNKDAALMELIGHMPIIASALVLMFFGYGQRLKITSLFRQSEKTVAEGTLDDTRL